MKGVAVALSISGVIILATWVQAPAAPSRADAIPTTEESANAEQTAQSVTPVARQVDAEAERLRQHLAERVPFNTPARDPFTFKKPKATGAPTGSEPFSTESREKGSDPVVLKTPASPPIAVPALIGLTEDAVAGIVTRSAVLAMGDAMAIVKVGQSFDRFIVRSIGASSIELVDVTSPSHAVTTIAIR